MSKDIFTQRDIEELFENFSEKVFVIKKKGIWSFSEVNTTYKRNSNSKQTFAKNESETNLFLNTIDKLRKQLLNEDPETMTNFYKFLNNSKDNSEKILNKRFLILLICYLLFKKGKNVRILNTLRLNTNKYLKIFVRPENKIENEDFRHAIQNTLKFINDKNSDNKINNVSKKDHHIENINSKKEDNGQNHIDSTNPNNNIDDNINEEYPSENHSKNEEEMIYNYFQTQETKLFEQCSKHKDLINQFFSKKSSLLSEMYKEIIKHEQNLKSYKKKILFSN
jgi:hypothetical protein